MGSFLVSGHERIHAGRGWLAAWVIAVAVAPVSALAQVTWDANTTTSGPQDGSGTWSTSDANWWNGTTDVVWPNLTTSSAIIGVNSGAAGTITASGSLTLNAITFNAPGSGTYTLTGGTLGFAGSSPTITANTAATIESAITSGVGLTKSGTGTLTLSGIVSNTAGTMTINRGAVTLTGTLTNTASGGFNIGGTNGGLLAITGGSMSTSWNNARAIVIGGGPGQSGTVSVSSGALSASGLYVSEDTGGNGLFTQSGGTVSIGSGNVWMAGNTSSLTVSGGSFTNNNRTYFAVGSTNPSTSTISVSGSGSITLGTLQYGISGRNGFTTTVNVGDGTGGGTLQVSSFVWSGATTVASTINFNSGTFVANGTITMPSQISTVVKAGGANISVANTQTLTLGSPLTDGGGSGGLRKLGSGALSLTGSNTYTGTTSIAAGSLSIGNALALQNSTLDLAASDTGTVSAIGQNSTLGGLTGSRNLDMLTRTLSIGNNGASTTYSGTLSNGALTKIGSGTFTLTGANAYTGATVIDAGVLQIGSSGTTGSLSTSSAISGSAGAGLVFSRTDNYGGNVANNIGGGIGLTLNSGTLALTGSNAYAGTTRISGGVLSLGAANALAGVGNVTFAGGTMQFTASNSGDFASRIKDSGSAVAIDTNGQNRTLAGSIDSSNAAGLVKSGAGTLVLSGSNSFSGGVTLTGGQVQIANANALGTGTFTTNVDIDTTIPFNLPTSSTVTNAITINKPGSNRTYYFQQNQSNNVALAGNITVASGNFNQFTLNGVSTGTFTLTGSNTFGNDIYTSANMTFRIGGTNAAGTGVWRPNATTKLVLLDGANFGATVGNAIASYSMESSGTASVTKTVFNRNTANVTVDTPADAQLSFSGIAAEGGFTTGTFSKTGAGTWVVNNSGSQMTYNVLEGTMQVPTFEAIGPSSTGVFVFLGSAGKAGTLSYTGATASSNKPFTATAGGTAAFAVTSAATTLTLSGLIDGGGDVSFGGPGSYVLSGGISAANVFKTGTGSVTLSVGNSQANTTVSAGQLNVNHLAALGTPAGTLTMAAGTRLDNTSGAAVTVTNPKSIALGSSLTFVGSNDLDLGTGNVTLSGNTEFAIAAKELTLSGDVIGAGFGITKTGAGTLRLDGLTGASSFNGNSFVNAGTLLLEGNSILGGGTSTVVTVADGAFLQIGASAGLGNVTVVSRPAGIVTANVVNANQTFDQSGTLTTSNGNFNGVQTIESGVTITAGHNYLGTVPATTTAGRIVFQDNAKIRVTTGFELDSKQGISLQSGTAIFESDANQALLIPSAVAGSGGIRKIGAGNIRLTGSNTYSGGTVIEEGIVGISYGESLGDVAGGLKLDGGTIVAAQVLSGGTISAVTIDSGRSVVLANGKTSGMDAQTGLTLRYDGVIAEENGGGAAAGLRIGSGAPRQGTVILGGANTYRGDTTISFGTLKLASGGSFANSSRIIVGGSGSSGVALDLTEKSSFSIGAGQTLMGGGSVNLGAGTVLTVAGTFSPGNSPGLFTYSSGTTVLDGTTVMEIFGTSRATAPSHGSGFYDAVNIANNGVLQFGGSLTFEFSSLFDDNTIFDLFTPASGSALAGNFTGVNVIGSFYTGLSWNQTGSVWKSSNTTEGQSLEFNSLSGQLIIVPEPASLFLLLSGTAAAIWAFRRRR